MDFLLYNQWGRKKSHTKMSFYDAEIIICVIHSAFTTWGVSTLSARWNAFPKTKSTCWDGGADVTLLQHHLQGTSNGKDMKTGMSRATVPADQLQTCLFIRLQDLSIKEIQEKAKQNRSHFWIFTSLIKKNVVEKYLKPPPQKKKLTEKKTNWVHLEIQQL